jgi:nitrogen fixation-related uncharacterized protein
MRTMLITGLLLCLPTAVLLVAVSLAVLAGQLHRLTRSQFSDLPTAGPDREELRDDVTPASAGRLYRDLSHATDPSWPGPGHVCASAPLPSA